MFYLFNDRTQQFAAQGSHGEHDGQVVPTLEGAAAFESWGSASDFNQNFGPDWQIEDYS